MVLYQEPPSALNWGYMGPYYWVLRPEKEGSWWVPGSRRAKLHLTGDPKHRMSRIATGRKSEIRQRRVWVKVGGGGL